jgi:hypothetical protein
VKLARVGGRQGSDSNGAEHTILFQGLSVDRILLEVKPVLEKFSLPAGSYLQIQKSKKVTTKIPLK